MNINDQYNLFDQGTFDGSDYDPVFDADRLKGQIRRIWDFMADGSWHTLQDIENATNAPQASASAMLREFRKERYGSHTVIKRRKGDPYVGQWEYQLIIKK